MKKILIIVLFEISYIFNEEINGVYNIKLYNTTEKLSIFTSNLFAFLSSKMQNHKVLEYHH